MPGLFVCITSVRDVTAQPGTQSQQPRGFACFLYFLNGSLFRTLQQAGLWMLLTELPTLKQVSIGGRAVIVS